LRQTIESLQADRAAREKALRSLALEQNKELRDQQQLVRHILHENQSSLTKSLIEHELKLQASVQDPQRAARHEAEMRRRALLVQQKQANFHHSEHLKALKFMQERELSWMRQEFLQKAEELRLVFEEHFAQIRQKALEKKRNEVNAIAKEKLVHISKLMAEHKQAFLEIRNYFTDITHQNLELIKNLKVTIFF
jgi:hypothetical protein